MTRSTAVLESPRLVMRPIDVDNGDAEAMFALNADPDVVRYTGDGPFASIEAARAFVAAYKDVYAREGFGRWAVVPKAGEPLAGVNIGFCGLRRQHDGAHAGDVDLGYRLARATWGRGYATEAARATLAWGFDVARLARIIARAHVDNVRSHRVLEKVGMTRVGPVDMEGDPGLLFELRSDQR